MRRENTINIVNAAKRMAELFAFGEPTHARPIASELAWRSLNRDLGHSWTSQATSSITNNFATLSFTFAPMEQE